jgi:hypothetical protein
MINAPLDIVLTTAYLPPVSWFGAIGEVSSFAVEAQESYQKGGWRNRCLIAGPNGVQMLSIPLEKGKHQQTPIRDVRIAYREDWPKNHWRSIRTAYGNAPYFEHYEGELVRFFEKKEVFLFDFNLALIHFLIKKIKWTGTVNRTETFQGATAMPEIKMRPYPQVFEERHGFLPGLSMLDALLCCGPKAGLFRNESEDQQQGTRI